MFDNLAFERGDLKEILTSNSLSNITKGFSSLSSADGVGILSYINEILKKTESTEEQIKLKLLAATVYLVNLNQRSNSINILNQLGKPDIKKISGWQEDLFGSLWQMLVIYLSSISEDQLISDENKSICVIGDSHTVGLSIKTRNLWNSGHYIPGFRLSLIASPQHNLKKEALKNAMAMNYDNRFILFSLGEIDFRMASLSFETDNQSFNVLEKFIEPALNNILNYSGHHQKIFINAPYPCLSSKYFSSSKIYSEVLNHHINLSKVFYDISNDMDIKILDMPEEILKDPMDSFKIDHAHFTPDIYKKIFQGIL